MSSVELIIIIITCTVLHQFVDTLQTVHVCFFKWLSIVAIPIIFSVLFILCLFILLSVTYPQTSRFRLVKTWQSGGRVLESAMVERKLFSLSFLFLFSPLKANYWYMYSTSKAPKIKKIKN